MTDKKRFTTIDEYISTFPGEIQIVLEQVRQAIHKAAPEATETMSYGIPTFDLNGKHLVFFAGWKQHISLYPLPAGDEAFQRELSHYKRVKGTIQFPFDKPIPYDFVEKIVTLLMMESPAEEEGWCCATRATQGKKREKPVVQAKHDGLAFSHPCTHLIPMRTR